MESISIVPSTVLNSIYVNDRKNCTGGSVVLEDRYTVYFMQVTDTTNISIDKSLLNIPTNCSLEFKLVVWSDKANVLNFSGCSIEQIEVQRGESTFTMQWTGGSNVWSVIPDVLSGYDEVLLQASSYPTLVSRGLATEGNLQFVNQYQSKQFDIFSQVSPYTLNTGDWYYGNCSASSSYSAYVYSIKPFMLRKLQIHWGASWSSTYFPTAMTIYGSNDGLSWNAIASSVALTNTGNRYNQEVSITGTNTFYRMFRFDFVQTTGSEACVPPISIFGYEGSLIDNQFYKPLMPQINAESSGYNVTSNASQMSSTSGSVYSLLNTGNDGYQMVRSDTSVNWEITYTLPTAEQICGIYLRTSANTDQAPTMLSIFGSNDNDTWTEVSKLAGSALYRASVGQLQDYTYMFKDTTAYQYWKVVIYSVGNTSYFELKTLQLISKNIIANAGFDTIIPVMESASQDGYVVSATNTDDGQYYQMFDGNNTTFCAGHFADGQWVVNIQLPQATAVNGVCLRARSSGSDYNQTPYAFTVQGSNDNDTWTVLDTEILGSSYWTYQGQLANFAFENTTPYTYYRLVCTASANGTYCALSELGLTTNGAMPNVNWTEDVYVVPVMASDSQDGYVASATSSFDSSYAPYKAFARNSSDCWVCADADQTDGNKECNVYLQIQLPTATAINVLNIVARTGLPDQSPSSFTLQASNNGSDWTTLLTVTDKDTYDSATWEVSNTTAYLYYKLAITKTNRAGSHVAVSGFNLINRVTHNS